MAVGARHNVTTVDEIDWDEEEDRRLVSRLRAGDPHGLDLLVHRHASSVLALVRRIVGCRATAEDVSQDVFVKVFERVNEFKETGSFRAWLFRIARRSALDALRDDRTRRRKTEEAQSGATRAQPGDGLEGLMQREFERAFEEALRSLPEPYRSTLCLREIEGLTYEEIASVLELSAKTVSSRLTRARAWMREQLVEFLESDGEES